ncbi:MAG: cell division ATP-binding protein FtsE [Microgenomates group bacterium]
MIKFENVSKKFPLGNVALKDISFEIKDEEFIFLVGPSGAGKTTILKLILREFLPTEGKILIGDWETSSLNFKEIISLRRKIGIVFQDFKILNEKTVFENIALSLAVLGLSEKKIKEEVMDALKMVNLEGKERLFPLQLSAGELQRVAIARAVVGERKILLADEPTGNVDPKTAWEIMRLFKKWEKKRTIIIATHNVDIVNSMQKRVLILKNGQLVKDLKKGGYEI